MRKRKTLRVIIPDRPKLIPIEPDGLQRSKAERNHPPGVREVPDTQYYRRLLQRGDIQPAPEPKKRTKADGGSDR
jgi:hypothetical protein